MKSSDPPRHLIPLRTYFSIAAALLILTGITVWVSTINFGPWNLIIAMTVAALKGTLVVLIFMHLRYDNKLYAVVFYVSYAIPGDIHHVHRVR